MFPEYRISAYRKLLTNSIASSMAALTEHATGNPPIPWDREGRE
jgi:hypothetical protein